MHYQACIYFWDKAKINLFHVNGRVFSKNKNFSKYRATYLSSNLHIHSIVNDCFHKYSRYTSLDINEKIFLQWKQKILFENGLISFFIYFLIPLTCLNFFIQKWTFNYKTTTTLTPAAAWKKILDFLIILWPSRNSNR